MLSGWVAWTILALYYLCLVTLAVYGLHRLKLVWIWWRTRHDLRPRPEDPEIWPVVTVQLPIFNEQYVAQRLIDTVCALDYPRDRLEIQVLDDSTDTTVEIARARVEHWRAAGVDIHHVHRTDREGFKAGALKAGQEVARGELLAVFDADFVPQSEFLKVTVPWFDEETGMVQARWGHLNRDYSLLTRIQAIFLDGHFVIEHTARERSGCFFNFNGTAGIWRRQAIVDAGGWEHDTLTEDLDLSYRAQLAGWKFRYLPDVVVPAELPAEISAYKSQQNRWSKGSIQTCRKLFGKVMAAKEIPLRARAEAAIHLTNNFSYVLMILLSLLVFPAMALRRDDPHWMMWAFDLPIFLAATVSVIIFYLAAQRAVGASWGRALWRVFPLMGLGIGLAVNNSRAVIQGLTQNGGVFHRTPKFSLEGKAGSWSGKSYLLSKNPAFWLEAFLAIYFLACFALAIELEMWMSIPFLMLFLHGYVYIFLLGFPFLRRRVS